MVPGVGGESVVEAEARFGPLSENLFTAESLAVAELAFMLKKSKKGS
jgi:hypothetical protein